MNSFIYQYPVRQYFGKGCAKKAVKGELEVSGRIQTLYRSGKSRKGNKCPSCH